MNKFTTVVAVFCLSISNYAQVKEPSFKDNAEKILKAEFPSFRMLNVEYMQMGNSSFNSQLLGEDFQKGNLENQKSISVGVNLPVYRKKKLTITTSLNYKFNEFKFNNLENISTTQNFQQNEIVNFQNFSTALSATYFSSLFAKPIIYNSSIIVDGNDQGIQRLKGMLGASLILKKTERTTITIGAVAFIDPTSQFPFFPTFTYNHKLKNSAWDIDFILPQRILLRRYLHKNGRISIGSMLNSNSFYVNIDNPNFPTVSQYSQLEINSGVIYEHKASNNFIITFKGGISNFVSSRLTEKGQPNKDYFYKNDQSSKGYFNVGISYNPAFKKQ